METNQNPIISSPEYVLVEIINKYESGLMAKDERFAYIGEGRAAESIRLEVQTPTVVDVFTIDPGQYVYFEPVPVSEIIEKDNRRFVLVKVENIKGADND